MQRKQHWTRRDFVKTCVALTGGGLVGRRLIAEDTPGAASLESVHFKSWEVVEFPARKEKFRHFIKITADNGAVGYCRALAGVQDISAAERTIAGENLLDHETLYDLMVSKNVPENQRKVLDIASWDLHARMLDQPLHAVLGTRKKKILRYGDVRWKGTNMTPKKYANQVASYFERSGMIATKLHFPGNMGTEDSILLKDVMATLSAVREAVGKDKILAWDPYPGSAESATTSLEEAKQMIQLMDELNYAWFEGPLPPVPYETQIPKYVELMQMKPRLRIQAEGPRSPIGDGTLYADMVRWVEAGAVNQCSTDAYIKEGLTHAKRFLDYAKDHPERKLVINLHWAWAPHAHLVMAYHDSVCPIAEFPMTEDIPKEYLDGPYLLAPDWPGVYCIE
jgi:L-alanine-DL-glutamate epimerase-like enolase superfamily enzyme